jgi:F0F1-type ATP synthase assembly protein I
MLVTASPGRVAVTPSGDTVGTPPEPSQPGAFSMFGALTGLAVLIACLVAGAMALGYLLDNVLSTPHVFLFAGLVLGVAAAVLATRSIVTRYFRS